MPLSCRRGPSPLGPTPGSCSSPTTSVNNSCATPRASPQIISTLHAGGRNIHTSPPCNKIQECSFANAVGLGCELFGTRRLMRFSMLVDDGVVRSVNMEKEANDLGVSSADHMWRRCSTSEACIDRGGGRERGKKDKEAASGCTGSSKECECESKTASKIEFDGHVQNFALDKDKHT